MSRRVFGRATIAFDVASVVPDDQLAPEPGAQARRERDDDERAAYHTPPTPDGVTPKVTALAEACSFEGDERRR